MSTTFNDLSEHIDLQGITYSRHLRREEEAVLINRLEEKGYEVLRPFENLDVGFGPVFRAVVVRLPSGRKTTLGYG